MQIQREDNRGDLLEKEDMLLKKTGEMIQAVISAVVQNDSGKTLLPFHPRASQLQETQTPVVPMTFFVIPH